MSPQNKNIFFAALLFLFISSGLQCFAANWYVNDGATTGDIYCSAIGNNGNTGTAASPFATVSHVIANKVLAAGDKVYVDAGTYADTWSFNTNADGGSAGNVLTIQGAGTTLTKNILPNGNAAYFNAAGNCYITVKNIHFESGDAVAGYVGDNSTNIIFNTCSFKVTGGSSYCVQFYEAESCRCMFSTLYHTSTGDGIGLYYGSNHVVEGNTITLSSKVSGNRVGVFMAGTGAGASVANSCTIAANKISGANYGFNIQQQGTGNTWVNNYVWDCDNGIFASNGGVDHPSNTFKFNSLRTDKDCMTGDFNTWTIKNNIFYLVGGTGYYCITMNDATHDPTVLNYNLYYYPTAGGQAAFRNGVAYATLSPDWDNVFNSNEANGITGNPTFTSSTDLSLQAGSPAIDVALTDGAVTDDVRRNSSYIRPGSSQDIGAFEYNATLPIHLINFKASYFPNGNALNWTTGSEINNDFFTLERSYNGKDFTAFETVKGAGNSSAEIAYAATDPGQFDGTVYYRLKQTDYDGAFSYSKIVSVSSEKNAVFNTSVYPNPSSGKTTFFFIADEGGMFQFGIYDLEGNVVYSAVIAGVKGENKFDLNIAHLTNGIYFANITSANNTASGTKFVKAD